MNSKRFDSFLIISVLCKRNATSPLNKVSRQTHYWNAIAVTADKNMETARGMDDRDRDREIPERASRRIK